MGRSPVFVYQLSKSESDYLILFFPSTWRALFLLPRKVRGDGFTSHGEKGGSHALRISSYSWISSAKIQQQGQTPLVWCLLIYCPTFKSDPKSKIPLTLAVSEWNTSSAAKRVYKFINDNVVKMKEWTRKTFWQNRNCQKTEVVRKRSYQDKVDITCMFVTRNRIRLSCRAGNSSWSSKFQISKFFRKLDWNYKIHPFLKV